MAVLAKDLKAGDRLVAQGSSLLEDGRLVVVAEARPDHIVTTEGVRLSDWGTLFHCCKVIEPDSELLPDVEPTNLGKLLKREFEQVKAERTVEVIEDGPLKRATLDCRTTWSDDALSVDFFPLGGGRGGDVRFLKLGDSTTTVLVNDPLVLRAFIDDLTVLHGRLVEAKEAAA